MHVTDVMVPSWSTCQSRMDLAIGTSHADRTSCFLSSCHEAMSCRVRSATGLSYRPMKYLVWCRPRIATMDPGMRVALACDRGAF